MFRQTGLGLLVHSVVRGEQEGRRGSPNGGNRLQASGVFSLSLKQTTSVRFFPFSIQNYKGVSFTIYVAMTTPGSTRTQLFSNLELSSAQVFLWKCFS